MEPSSVCNLDCPDCPTASGRGGGIMKYADFIHVVDQLPMLRLINLWHRGEPLTAPDIFAMISEATRRNIRTQIHTNGILLARNNNAAQLVKAGLFHIAIGIDGADEETYRRVRKGGSLAEVEAGVKALVKARNKLNSKTPYITAECLVTRQTKEQFQAVHELALKLGCDSVKFKTYRVPNPMDLDTSVAQLPNNPKLWRYKQVNDHLEMKRYHQRCWRLSYSVLVAWNGNVLPCCFHSNENIVFGNAFEEPWKDIWRGGLKKAFYYSIKRIGRDIYTMCRNCTEGLPRLYLPKKLVLK